MRKRAIILASSAIAVAVLVLGIPGLIFGSTLLWNDAVNSVEKRASIVSSLTEQRLENNHMLSARVLELYARPNKQLPVAINVTTNTWTMDAGKKEEGAKITRTVIAADSIVTVELLRSRVVKRIMLFCLAGCGGIVFSFGCGTAFALRQSRRLSAPLIYLAAAAEQLGAGQTRPQMKPSGIEEIDLVYDEIVRSADRIAGRISAERNFSSIASHQLRTPLTALSMRLEEILYTSEEEATQEEARACLEQVDRLGKVIDDLVLHSRSVASSMREVVHVEKIFAQQKKEWYSSFHRHGRDLVIECEEECVALSTPSTLSQVIATLIENSMKYGDGRTSIRAYKMGKGVVIDVSDEGKGVAEENKDLIFTDGFSTGDSSGIGLPLARRLIENDAGRIDLAQAQPPIFRIWLPGVPRSLDPDRVLPAGSLITMGRRRRGR